MGHRALVAYEREDGYDLHYAHWGALDWGLAGEAAGSHTEREDGAAEGATAVDPVPIATGRSFESILASDVDFQLHEAFYRVPRSGPVEPYLVCWFGLAAAGVGTPRDGALVGVCRGRPRQDGAFLRGWFAGTKAVLADAVGRGDLAAAAVPGRLADALEARASGDRPVHYGPGASDG